MNIELVEPTVAEKICRNLSSDLPKNFGIPEANERYAMGMLERVSYVAKINNDANYLKTYQFYEKTRFKPLFELNTYGPDFLMVYLQKTLL